MSFLRSYGPNALSWALVLAGLGSVQCGAETRTSSRETPRQILQFDAFNLQVKVPREPWVQSTPEETGSRARLLISRSKPTIVISLAAERVGIKANATNRSLLAAAQAKMRNLPDCEVLPGEQEVSANGIQGLAFEASVAVEGGRMVHYSIWVATRNGYKYCVAAYGEQRDRDAVDDALFRFLSGIKQLEPFRVASPADGNL